MSTTLCQLIYSIDIHLTSTYNQFILHKEVISMPQGQISENNTRISIVIPKDLKLEADKVANSDGRSLSGWIRKLITDAISEYNKSDTSE